MDAVDAVEDIQLYIVSAEIFGPGISLVHPTRFTAYHPN